MYKIKLADHFCKINKNKNKNKNDNSLDSTIPEFDILINKQKRKLYGKKKNKVYLNNNDHIQFRLFNSKQKRIAVQFEFNGNLERRMIVIKPGEKIILDRYLDSKRKIKYSTYFVDNKDKRVDKAIKNNGKVVLYFWEEKDDLWYLDSSYNNTNKLFDYNSTTHTSNTGTWLIAGDKKTSDTNVSNFQSNISQKETGRLDEGKKSKQIMNKTRFKPHNMFYKKKIKLLPSSKKKNSLDNNIKTVTIDSHDNYYRNTDHRVYCSNSSCGYRIRNKNWNYCPLCGHIIN